MIIKYLEINEFFHPHMGITILDKFKSYDKKSGIYFDGLYIIEGRDMVVMWMVYEGYPFNNVICKEHDMLSNLRRINDGINALYKSHEIEIKEKRKEKFKEIAKSLTKEELEEIIKIKSSNGN